MAAADNAGNTDTCFQEVNVFGDEFPAVVAALLGFSWITTQGNVGQL